jgi:DivIVA domain-containing protein
VFEVDRRWYYLNRVTPMEIFDKDFKKSMRGYDIKDVDGFLDIVLQSYEDVLSENKHLKEQLRRLKRDGGGGRQTTSNNTALNGLAAYEKVLKEIMMRLERLEKMNFG